MPSGVYERKPKESKLKIIERAIERRKSEIAWREQELIRLEQLRAEVENMPDDLGKQKIYVSERSKKQAESLRKKWREPETRALWLEGMRNREVRYA